MRKLKLLELNRIDEDEFKSSAKAPIKIILDNIRSGHNVGSAFRTADAFRIDEVVLGGITPTPPHREILKTALGADESVTWRHGEALEFINEFKKEGYKIYAVEQTDSSTMLQKFQFDNNDKIALIFGNEVKGVDSKLLEHCDGCLEIPQHGTKHSFNVSVSMGIVLWELCRNRAYS